MIQFPDSFLLLFGTLAVGGFFCLSVLPFNYIERGFYKSSAAVFLTSALIIAAGKITLLVRAETAAPGSATEAIAWVVFTLFAALYLYSLWGDPYRLRARAYALTLLVGIVALFLSASRFRLAPIGSIETVLYPAAFLASAAAFGTAVTGMLLGHWYLIDTGMSLEPLRLILKTFVMALAMQLGVAVVTVVALSLFCAPETAGALQTLWDQNRSLLIARFSLGPLPALVIAAMISRTLAIPQTMAATGLFYIAVLAVAVGEMLSRLLLLRTSLPL